MTPVLPGLYRLVHLLVGPGKVQKCMHEGEWHNLEDDFRDPQSPTWSSPP